MSSSPTPARDARAAAGRLGAARSPRTGRARARDILLNWPLLAGLLIVAGLLLTVLFGPLLAPENPYLAGQRAVRIEGGRVVAPPFPPGPGFPLGTDQWGRDILSLLLYGTRNTLVACLFIATARVILGWILGAAAGWHEGCLVDRVIMGAIELTTSLPMLLTGVLLILAFDIRRGIVVFMAALCLVGWGEIAQYVRAEFMVVRRRPFIEGARVVGLDGLGIAVRHVLPNVLPALTVLALLEMGAVLMILGELGFVGIFIGGGTAADSGDLQVTIPDIPEWGAMMAGSRQWARSQPWMVFFPALAFFVAVLGFNLLGEGLRRLIQRGGINTSFVFSRKMLVVLAAIVLSTAYIVTHVGPAPSYARLAQRFDQGQALTHLQALAGGPPGGRALGTPGAQAAAEYVAARFEEYGLHYVGASSNRYFQEVRIRLVRPLEQPELALLAPDGTVARAFQHRVDFGADILRHGGSGSAEAPLAFIDLSTSTIDRRDFKGLDLRGRVAMYVLASAPPDFDLEALVRGAEGLLLVDEDARPRLQLAQEGKDYLRPPTIPTFRITPAVADALLAVEGLSLEKLAAGLRQAPPGTRWRQTDLGLRVRLSLQLSPVEEIVTHNVLGVWPGADVILDDELVIVSTHYDAAGQDPDGTLFAGANDNASGVAVMLDILRLWREQGFNPRRTVVFAAWAGGTLEHGGAYRYADSIRVSPLRPVAALHLFGVGRGGDALVIGGERGELRDLAQRSAAEIGSQVVVEDVGYPSYHDAFAARCPSVVLSWQGAERIAASADDPVEIDPDKLSRAGQIANLMLITLSREPRY